MDFSGWTPSEEESNLGQQTSKGIEPPLETPIKYTPVTGRISRAKKAVPVHTCNVCRPVKTFTRAEYLRRHQLSHTKPAYPCTFEDCEGAFHRPDLLARHLHRHETQGEKTYKSGDSRSRASSSESDIPFQRAALETKMMPSSVNSITTNFPSVNFRSLLNSSHERSEKETHKPDIAPYSPEPMTNQNDYRRAAQSQFDEVYSEGGKVPFASYTATPQLPLLNIPEETYTPGLSYTQENSPWCSSSSNSTYSTQSDGPQNLTQWSHRGRSASVATIPDWPATTTHWSSNASSDTLQDFLAPPFESMLDLYDTSYMSPRMTPPNTSRGHQFLDVSDSFAGIYKMSELYTKPLSALSPFWAQSGPHGEKGSGGSTAARKQFLLLDFDVNAGIKSNYQRQELDLYISSYWEYFDELFPIIHRASYNPEEQLLTAAMAAIGTQFHYTLEARMRGSELNEACRKGIDSCLNWSIHTMQAILLTEIFSRFRGRKTIVRTSRHFEALCHRLLNDCDQGITSSSFENSGLRSEGTHANALRDRFGQRENNQKTDLRSEWTRWIYSEERRRLFNACYTLDIRQAICHGQNRTKVLSDGASSLLLLPCQDIVWTAPNAEEWQIQTQKLGQDIQPLPLIQTDPPLKDILGQCAFVQSLLLSNHIIQIPALAQPNHPQIAIVQAAFPDSLLAHTYLAIHNTPLHDLLAVAGDTWVFAQKLTPPSAFRAAQVRLGTWSSSLAAVSATQHACKILSLTFSQNEKATTSIFDYWGLYIAALICWAYGHHSQKGSENFIEFFPESSDDTSQRVLTFANTMLKLLTFGPFSTSKIFVKLETSSVIEAVRKRLEIDCVGNKSSLLVDACTVLAKVQEGGRGGGRLWFPAGPTHSPVKTEVPYHDDLGTIPERDSIGQAFSSESGAPPPRLPNISSLDDEVKTEFKQGIKDENKHEIEHEIMNEIKEETKDDTNDMASSSFLPVYSDSTEEVKCDTVASSSDLISSPTAKIPSFHSNMSSPPHLKLQCRSPTRSDSHESPSTKSSNQSSGFETDSNYSEDEFESIEDSNFRWAGSGRSPDIFQVIYNEILCRKIKDQDALIRPVLAPLKQAMVERIMTEFWVIFNQEWSASVRKCADASSTPSPSAKSDPTPSKPRASNYTGKRSAEHDDDRNQDEDDDRDPKRPKKTKSQLGDRCDSVMKFACPYRKFNPQKYCIRNWRLCALTPLDSVSRVKGHLYRYHRVFQCARCKEIFQNQEDLDGHFIAVASCERRLIEPAEGITGALEKQLRSRKKTHPDQTEEERWIQIYKILFPGASVPCAYFEPVQEESMASPDSQQLSNYEEFSRAALPRFFRAALEEAIYENTQPIEEKLKSQLVDMIRDCQDRVFSTYRSRFPSNTAATPAASMLSNPRLRPSFPDPNSEGQTNLDSQGVDLQLDQPSDILGTFFHEPPAPKSLDQPSKFQLVFGNASMVPVTNAPSELSSISDPSMLYSSNSLGTEYTVATDTSNAGGFGTQPQDDHSFTHLNESGLKPDDRNTAAGASFDFDPEFPMEDLFVLFSDSGNC